MSLELNVTQQKEGHAITAEGFLRCPQCREHARKCLLKILQLSKLSLFINCISMYALIYKYSQRCFVSIVFGGSQNKYLEYLGPGERLPLG